MDFAALIKKSFYFAWNHRVLWLFGFLSGGVGVAGVMDPSGFFISMPDFASDLESFFTQVPTEILLTLVLVGFFLILTILVVGLFVTSWAGSSLVFSILNRESSRPTFRAGAAAGLKYWVKFFFLGSILGLFVLVFFAMLALPVILLFLANMKPLAIIALVLTSIIFVVSLFVTSVVGSLITTFAQRLIIEKGSGVLDSIRLAGGLVKKYLGEALLAWLVGVALNFGVSFVTLFAALPLLGIVFIAFLLNPMAGIVLAIPALVLLFAVAGFWHAFLATYWTLVYEYFAAKEG